MIKLTRLDDRPLWIAKGSITTIDIPEPGEWHWNVKAVVNGTFGVRETPEQILEMLK